MKTTVVTGMLGSGKTTFVVRLLSRSGEPAVVLVNDFGSLGIDGEILSAGGIDAIELPSGCICCTLKSDLVTAIGRIRERYDPDHLVIEPSGVASPSGVLEALESAGVARATVVGLVDATEFLELQRAEAYGAFFLDQIVNADVLLVNKTDLAGEEVAAQTAAVVEALNPGALVIRTVQARIDAPLPGPRRPVGFVRAAHAHFRFESLALRLAPVVPFAALELLTCELAAGRYGAVARVKALACTDRGPWRFDVSFGSRSNAPFQGPVAAGRLVVIGEGLDRAGITRSPAVEER